MRKYLFLNQEATGTLPALTKDLIPSLLKLQDEGFLLVGFGENKTTFDFLVSQGVSFSKTFETFNPLEVAREFLLEGQCDRTQSRTVGSIDLQALDIQKVPSNDWKEIATALLAQERIGRVVRKTNETTIEARVNLDKTSPLQAKTGIGFFDHMLEQLAKHAGFSLLLEAKGDLHIDEHHTVEDAALTLGEALRKALGDKIGIGRYGFLLPMDETESKVSIDLSGRPWVELRASFPREAVGGLSTEMVEHFFHSFAQALGATLHLEVKGQNAHHMVEASFKGVGRALAPALKKSGRELPSTKGVL